ncbi:MAG TPA: tetratricopeptide repeat protein [Candidatus Limnocylindrales bacterium]|nr:tetratricopeptide repeat protein [Candidatus Limnocylindrales bacterium]
MRAAAILAAAILIVMGSYLAQETGRSAAAPAAAVPANVPAVDPPVGAPSAVNGTAASLAQIDRAIGVWSRNLAAEPLDFVSAANLGIVYEARGRLTGDIGDYLKAQQAVAQALDSAPTDDASRLLHARLAQTLHEFPNALAEAQAILRDEPGLPQALATEGDAQLELGDVAGAKATFTALATAAPGAAVSARLARLAFISGDPAAALGLAGRAYNEAVADDQTGPSLGWYAYLAGTVALSTGAPTDALAWFDKAVAVWPDGYLALAGQARAQAALGHTDKAIATYGEAIAIAPQPDALTALGDLYALRGDAKLAADQYATVEAIGHLVAINQQVYNRQLVLFSVNHDRDLAEALRLAEQELTVRKDVYGYDADAWALLANGRPAEADAAMRQALAFGTEDALLSYHAGMIAIALGDTARAANLLHDALAKPGALDPLSASRAAAALASLL